MRALIAVVISALAVTAAHAAQAVDSRSRGEALLRLSSLLGAEVVDAQRRKLGNVEEVMVDAAGKRLSHALVRRDNGEAVVELSAGILFEDRKLVAPRLTRPAAAAPTGGELHRATEILEARVQDWQGREIAKLRDIVVAREDGRIRYAVVTVDEGIGHPERDVAIRMPAMAYERVGSNDVVLLASRGELDGAAGVDMRNIQ